LLHRTPDSIFDQGKLLCGFTLKMPQRLLIPSSPLRHSTAADAKAICNTEEIFDGDLLQTDGRG